jgi:hypothetical protein
MTGSSYRKGKTYEMLYGRKKGEEIKIKITKAHLGKSMPNHKGHKHNQETKNKIRIALIGKKQSPEHKLHNSLSHIGIPTWNRGMGNKCKRKTRRINGIKFINSHVIWTNQKENLPYVPKGFIIHHIDGNGNNDIPENLFLIDKNNHIKLHNTINKMRLEL